MARTLPASWPTRSADYLSFEPDQDLNRTPPGLGVHPTLESAVFVLSPSLSTCAAYATFLTARSLLARPRLVTASIISQYVHTGKHIVLGLYSLPCWLYTLKCNRMAFPTRCIRNGT